MLPCKIRLFIFYVYGRFFMGLFIPFLYFSWTYRKLKSEVLRLYLPIGVDSLLSLTSADLYHVRLYRHR